MKGLTFTFWDLHHFQYTYVYCADFSSYNVISVILHDMFIYIPVHTSKLLFFIDCCFISSRNPLGRG